jgi:cyclic beta-1,2-glucan synthetase
MWAVLAFAKLGAGDKAAELFALLNPINHARTADEVKRYKVEPYVVAADVYSISPHVGRGGWTWYTGSAAWMYRAGLEGILGIRREGDFIVVDPCIPAEWSGYEATVKVGLTRYDIRVDTSAHGLGDTWQAVLDGSHICCAEGRVRVPLDGRTHSLRVDRNPRTQ